MESQSKKPKGPKPLDARQRFWRFVQLASVPGNCWTWIGALRNGYGVIGVRQSPRVLYAHRLSYEIHFGEIPPGMMVCHTCDNRRCVYPAHLFIGKAIDNAADASAKGRLSGWSRRKGAKKKHVEAQYGITIREV